VLGVMMHGGMKYVKKDYTGPSDDSPYSASTTAVWRPWVKKRLLSKTGEIAVGEYVP